jgi:hypothetical protein
VSARLAGLAWALVATLGTASMVACGPSGTSNNPNTQRLWTDDFYIRVTPNPAPPRALEQIEYTVVVQDRKTRQPIDIGEGRIFATNEDRKNTDNGFEKGAEPGTYRTKLFFATAGPWAMGVQFRRDSTQQLQRTNDWMQDVLPATEPSQDAAKTRSGQ